MDEQSSRIEATAREWLERARLDMDNARSLYELHPSAYDNVGFLCQQATEKIIKEFLVSHGEVFPKTHDIRTLLVGCVVTVDPVLAVEARFADELTPYAIAARYPLGFEPVSRETAAELIATMDRAWALFEPRILELIETEEQPVADSPAEDAINADE